MKNYKLYVSHKSICSTNLLFANNLGRYVAIDFVKYGANNDTGWPMSVGCGVTAIGCGTVKEE